MVEGKDVTFNHGTITVVCVIYGICERYLPCGAHAKTIMLCMCSLTCFIWWMHEEKPHSKLKKRNLSPGRFCNPQALTRDISQQILLCAKLRISLIINVEFCKYLYWVRFLVRINKCDLKDDTKGVTYIVICSMQIPNY